MSNLKLTLRPPPNVDFVHGYPGIPPGQDRPQAAVKGAIEVRTPPVGVKAQWVRIELRKVETLPGGGDSNTFYDYVGPSPVTLWSASDEYNVLRTQDFPFSIRIPESIPPSITLENRAGIQYELVATVCTKGKRGFLRRRKNIVTKEISPVTIDKHELHSTWPVYCQPEKRQLAQDGVTLIVERRNTCYGPGDRIMVVATLKSDSLHTVILRGFELMLKESTVYHTHSFPPARKTAPIQKVLSIAETKLAINATLYGGTMHQAELSCQLPPNHTTTTLNAARHIDVTYVLSVKALMGTGTQITMDLPLVISNWQRFVSQEATRRIGVAPALSLVPASSSTPAMSVQPTSPPRPQQAATIATLPSATHGRTPSTGQYSSTAGASGRPETTDTDELGYGVGYGKNRPRQNSDTKGYQNEVIAPRSPTTASSPAVNPTARRPNSARANNPANRFTITNAEPELPEEHVANNASATVMSPVRNSSISKHHHQQHQQTHKAWPSATEEKRAYELARSKVEVVQGVATPPAPVPVPTTVSPPPGAAPSSGTSQSTWISAQEEKARFEKAQAAVGRAHRQAVAAPERSPAGSSGSGGSKLSPSELYQQAMANVNAYTASKTPQPQPPSPHISPLSGRSRNNPGPATTNFSAAAAKIPQYLTADQEKEALKRYEEARLAVDRLHNPMAQAPIAYDSLYPKAGGSSAGGGSGGGHGVGDLPPPSFEASVTPSAPDPAAPMSAAAEKALLAERMRQADLARQESPPPPSFTAAVAPTPDPTPQQQYPQKQFMDAAAEKEMLRRKLEARDVATSVSRKKSSSAATVTAVPPRNASLSPGTKPAALPPPFAAGAAVLTAEEEKAMLRAKFDAQDAAARAKSQRKQTNGHGHGHHAANKKSSQTSLRMPVGGGGSATPTPVTLPPVSPSSVGSFQQQQQQQPGGILPPGPPPPLMPRPPAEYIQETQDEDARVSRFAIDGASVKLDDGLDVEGESEGGGGGVYVNGNGFAQGQGQQKMGMIRVPGPPPPLPPKPAGE